MTKLEFIAGLWLQCQRELFRFRDHHGTPEAQEQAADRLLSAHTAFLDGLRTVVPDEEMP